MTNSRRKGKDAELEAAKVLSRILGVASRRGVQYQGGADSPDVVLSISGVHVEVKRVEKLNIHDAVDQSANDAPPDAVPIVMHRRNRKPWLITLRADDLMSLINTLSSQINVERRPTAEADDHSNFGLE